MDESVVFFGIIQFIVLLLSLAVHESAHAWTASRLGDPTARMLGRVSLNPIVHADPIGTVLLPLLGIFTPFPVFGWAKPVPVMVSQLRNPKRDHMLVAAAGPASNLLIAVVLTGFLLVLRATVEATPELLYQMATWRLPMDGHPILVPMVALAFSGVLTNLILAVFNMIPLAPLDGAAVLEGLLPKALLPAFLQLQSFGFMILLFLMIAGVPRYIFRPFYVAALSVLGVI